MACPPVTNVSTIAKRGGLTAISFAWIWDIFGVSEVSGDPLKINNGTMWSGYGLRQIKSQPTP